MMSSPHYHQSNGKAESAVKIAKKLLTRASDSGTDPLLALLECRNTPSPGFDTSPVQRLMSRRTKTPLIFNNQLLKPKINAEVQQQLRVQRYKQK